MTEFLSFQCNLFLLSLLYGAVIGLFYDCFRLFRYMVHHGTVATAFEDFIFWMWTAFLICDLLYRYNYGSIRIYAFVGLIAGFLFYHMGISPLFMKFTKFLYRKVKCGCCFIMGKIKGIFNIFSKKENNH